MALVRIPLIVLLLLSTYASSQQSLPDAPAPQPKPSTWHELPDYHPRHLSWLRDHPTRTTWLLIGIVAGAGLAIGYVQRRHAECPSSYDGQPYQGTPPCPK